MSLTNLFIQKDSSLTFKTDIGANTLTIDVKVKEEQNDWSIEGKASLTQNESTLEYLIKKTSIAAGEVKFLGSWMPSFEKPGVHINFHPTISYEKFGDLSNETLLSVLAATNGVFVKSEYLEQTK